MKRKLLRALVPFAALALAACMLSPMLSIAGPFKGSMFEEPRVDTVRQYSSNGQSDCTLTVKYYEAVYYDDPDVVVDESSRVLLGEHVVDGLHEGDVISAWDYVVDIPGHMFFDGWPAAITISADPSQNQIELMYVKLWNSEFTVNYYLMLGADLTADNWTDALAPEDVEFIKMGSETFENQRYDSLVKGDAYQYKLDGMYVIDTYPAQIRLDLNPDNNVLNVLYTPDSVNLPDNVEIPDDIAIPGDEDGDGNENGGSEGEGLPDDTTMSKDDLIALLPDDYLVAAGDNVEESGDSSSEVVDDFIGNDVGEGDLDVTDEMLENTIGKDDAEAMKQAYQTGIKQARDAAKTSDLMRATPYICIALIAIVVFLTCALIASRRKKSE